MPAVHMHTEALAGRGETYSCQLQLGLRATGCRAISGESSPAECTTIECMVRMSTVIYLEHRLIRSGSFTPRALRRITVPRVDMRLRTAPLGNTQHRTAPYCTALHRNVTQRAKEP